MTAGKLSDKMAFDVGLHLTLSPNYPGIVKGCGAYERMAADPADAIPALKKGLAQVRRGTAVVPDVLLAKK